jgi:L-lactate dehydrogenase complex protein LldG
MSTTAKENILKKIRQALAQPVPVPFPQSEGNESVFHPSQQELEIEFAENFTKLQGRFSFCADENELQQQLNILFAARKWKSVFCNEDEWTKKLSVLQIPLQQNDLNTCDASITGCEALVARTGSMVLSSAPQSGRTVSAYAPVHICIAYSSQLVYDIKDALQLVKDKYQDEVPSLITLATGPSRTADIEKTLVVGVHGPKEVFCFVVEKAG